jgi:hypothetical protein
LQGQIAFLAGNTVELPAKVSITTTVGTTSFSQSTNQSTVYNVIAFLAGNRTAKKISITTTGGTTSFS